MMMVVIVRVAEMEMEMVRRKETRMVKSTDEDEGVKVQSGARHAWV